MTRVALGVLLLLAGACRRKHVVDRYASDTPAAAANGEPAAAPAAAPPAATAPAGSAAEASGAGDGRARLPDGGTLNGDPRGPRPAQWQPIVDGAMPALQACFDRQALPPGEIAVTMHYTVEPPGYTGAVTAAGSAPKEALDCCVAIVDGLKFPPYRGPKVARELAFTWSKRETTRSAAPPDGGAAKTP